jgi:O-acetyl-ADP-ribose deacetylase (regulator of RNase III)
MENYSEIEGDLIELAKEGKFEVIAHGCNCHSTMGAGIAPQMAKAFGCDRFDMELYSSDINKLGNIDYETVALGEKVIFSLDFAKNNRNEPELTIINAYTQYNLGYRSIDYEALILCLRKINVVFMGKHIGLPQIGCGLAGGDWKIVRGIIQRELKDCKVTIVIYNKK